MALHTEHLVGRADEMNLLDYLLEELEAGCSAAIEVVGEPGIGKTRLLAELGARADARAQLVLSGSASELERDLPFSVFVDALDEFLRGFDRSRLDALDEDVRTELAHVFPSLTGLMTDRDVALQHERYRSHRAVRALLERLAVSQPLVLVLDDLHWSDAASAELVGALLRRPPSERVLLAVAVRPRQIPDRLAAALERAHRAGLLTRIELGALSAEEARELLGASVDSADATVLYEESGGNPFYLEQLARSRDHAPAASAAHDEASLAAMGVPSAVAAALTEELALLSDSARRVLEAASAAGDPFEPELAAAAAEMPEATVMEAVDELLQVDLLRTTDMPRRFRFRHPLVRRAVYEATAAGWRLGAHERCAGALAARGKSAAARAHHVERSAREGDLDAVAVLREAGDQSVRLAPASAAHWFAEALRLLPETAPAEGASRAALRPLRRADGGGSLRRQPRCAPGGARPRARRRRRAACQARPRLCRSGEPARAARAGECAPRGRARQPSRPGVARGRGAHDRPRPERPLAGSLRRNARVGRARGERRPSARRTRL